MDGTGVPLVTPFTDSGAVDESKLRAVASWVVDRGVDFVVPAGSNSESELLTADERADVVATVADEVSVPVLAGTGHPGLVETLEQPSPPTTRSRGSETPAATWSSSGGHSG